MVACRSSRGSETQTQTGQVTPSESTTVTPRETTSVAPRETTTVAQRETTSVAPRETTAVTPAETSAVAAGQPPGAQRSDTGAMAQPGAAAAAGAAGPARGIMAETAFPGQGPEITHEFTGNPEQANVGRALFIGFNCYGCHGGLAGGAMGPSLRDTTWLYGNSPQAIYASIHDGRLKGMPRWGNLIPADQINLIVTYIQSMRTAAEPLYFFNWQDTLKAHSVTFTPPTAAPAPGTAAAPPPSSRR